MIGGHRTVFTVHKGFVFNETNHGSAKKDSDILKNLDIFRYLSSLNRFIEFHTPEYKTFGTLTGGAREYKRICICAINAPVEKISGGKLVLNKSKLVKLC